jgi:nitroreductase
VCGDNSLEARAEYMSQDLSAAVENILIAAQGLGLGAVWLGICPREERMAGMKALLKIPDGILPFALISIGYPAETHPPANRYTEERIHRNKW